MARSLSPSRLRQLREDLAEFHNLYIRYLELTSTAGGAPNGEASRLRSELRHQVAAAQLALGTAGVELAMYPAPAIGGPVVHGLPNLMFIHETTAGYQGMMGLPFCDKVIEALQVADGYLERRERDEKGRRRNPLYWLDLGITGLLGLPAYVVSRVLGVPVGKIDDSPVGFALRIAGLAVDALVVFIGGRGFGWW